MENRWFFWSRTILGKWTPVIVFGDRPGGKTNPGDRREVAEGIQRLEARHEGWTLEDCAREWPRPEERTIL